ncbi:MAG TPA: SWIB/MDM2 domain-containing protein, partial [Burkholderiales bacterium]|nr:SWIB/MDM2 domain-containing protein [Burkholderiales bacterium]
MRPLQPSAELARIVGSKPISRTEVTKKVWNYIKRHKLQDPREKRFIRADDKLGPVIGVKRISMFALTKK